MKVRELAKELRQKTKDLIKFLDEVDISVNSGSTKLDKDTVETVKELFLDKNALKAKKEEGPKEFQLDDSPITVGDFAKKLDLKISEVMTHILQKGLLLNVNSEIDQKTAQDIATSLGVAVSNTGQSEKVSGSLKEKLDQIEFEELDKDQTHFVKRPPIITIMGHVDHGKTQLLDSIREANVVAKEAGGITQHIGAYQVQYNEHTLTFLDTPGHEAFTSIRARGAQVTDLVILVVAADEGVKPQTLEALNHAKAAKIPILVAINKIDKPNANLDQVKQQLSQEELVAEDWGGDTIMVPVSAKNKTGIDDLLEMIILSSDMLELQADPTGLAKGVIIESKLSKQRGVLATALIKAGTLKRGSFFACGGHYGKVKALYNDHGKTIDKAAPGDPVEILGFSKNPLPGDIIQAAKTEKDAKELALSQENTKTAQTGSLKTVSLETLSQQISDGQSKKINIIVKADVHGSLEAIISSIEQIPTEEVSIEIIHSGAGPVTENDVMLAKASSAVLVSFNMAIGPEVSAISEREGVSIKPYTIIYEIVDDIKRVIEGMFTIEYEEIELGRAQVREIFKFSKVGKIAGCYVLSGNIKRGVIAKVEREGKVIFEGKVNSLKRFKEDAKEVATGYECGIVLDGFDDLQESDEIIAYIQKEKKKTL